MADPLTIEIKSSSFDTNRLLWPLLFAMFVLVMVAVVARVMGLTEEELGIVAPAGIVIATVGALLILSRNKKPTLRFQRDGDMVTLSRGEEVISQAMVEDLAIEYGYYTFRYRTFRSKVALVSFAFPGGEPMRCSFASTRLSYYWAGDDWKEQQLHRPAELDDPHYVLSEESFALLAQALVPHHALLTWRFR